MSRRYRMEVAVRGLGGMERVPAINRALCRLWKFDTHGIDGHSPLAWRWCGESSLVGGMEEEEFAGLVRDAVWGANGEPCDVEVLCTYLEDPPTEHYRFGQDNYG